MPRKPKVGWKRQWAEALSAVLLGNIVYFAAVPYLPQGLRHEPFQMDAGLAVDFAFCVLAYVAVRGITTAWGAPPGS